MVITINIDPKDEEKLVLCALDRGISLEQLVADVFEKGLERTLSELKPRNEYPLRGKTPYEFNIDPSAPVIPEDEWKMLE